MRVTILFFGMLKDITGVSKERVDVSEPASVQSVWDGLVSRFPRLHDIQNHLRPALNQEFSQFDAPLRDGDEVAFLPPVSGGSDAAGLFGLTDAVIDTRALVAKVQRDEDGAVVTFEGIVRNNTGGRQTQFLDYEGYEAMALRTIESLGRDIKEHHAIGEIAIVHRLGRVAVGEASVVIVVSAPHRKAAFDACFEAINRLKTTVPIWKKEHFVDGEVWVDGAWNDVPTPA